MSQSTPTPLSSEDVSEVRAATSPSRPSRDSEASQSRYICESVLGEGTMGVVHLARDRETGGQLAVKKLFGMDGKTVMRLKREFRSLADVSHPNLVKVYELGHAEDGWFLAMEYVRGQDMRSYLGMPGENAADSAMDSLDAASSASIWIESADKGYPDKVASTFFQLAQGVHALHRAGMLHRDLKPSNVLVSGERVVVLDFGLVRELSRQGPLLTEEGGIAGTPVYMAPEQFAAGELSEKSDWYAFGVMLYEALTYTLPFDGALYELMLAKQERDPVPPSALNPAVSPELERLCMALLARDPAVRPAGSEILCQLATGKDDHISAVLADDLSVQTETHIATAHAPFFGREAEFDALLDTLQRVEEGDSGVVHVCGPSGAGKTALIEHFLDEVELTFSPHYGAPPLVLRSRCYEREAMPFKALDSVVDALARHLVRLPDMEVSHLLPTGLEALSRLFPVLQRLRAVQRLLSTRPTDGDAVSSRQRAESALQELFGRLAAQRSVVIWIDDLQWGDLDSARILKGWMQEDPGLPVMLLLSYRSDEVATSDCLRVLLAGEGEREERGHKLELSPLGRRDMTALCEHRLGVLALGHSDVIERIVQEADGSPFLAAQLATLAQAKARRGDADYRRVSLGGWLAQITAILPVTTRHLLEVLAVAGRPMLVRHALRAAGVRSGGREHVHTLRRLQLVRSRTVGGERHLEVYHDRIREGVVANLSADENRRIHRRLLETLESSGRTEPDVLHALAISAGERVAALRYGLAAAGRASATLAFERSAALYQSCLELSEETSTGRKLLLRRLADALAWCGRGARAAETYLRAAELADGAEALQLMRFATSHFLRSGRFEEGEALVERLLAMSDLQLPATPARLMAAIGWERARLAFRGLSYAPREESEIPASELARIDLVGDLRMELLLIDPLRSSLLLLRQLRWALDAGEPQRVLAGLCGLCSLVSTGSAGADGRVEAILERVDALAAELGTPSACALVSTTRALAYWAMGRGPDALAPAEKAERLYRSPEGSQLYGAYFLCLSAVSVRVGVLLDLSQFEKCGAALTVASREVESTDNRAAALSLAFTATGYALVSGQGGKAIERLRQQRDHLPKCGFGIYHALHMSAVCTAAATEGEYAWALATLEEFWPQFLRSPLRRASMVHYLARMSRLLVLMNHHLVSLGAPRESMALLRKEIDALERPRFRGRETVVTIFRARIKTAAGDRGAAIAHLREKLGATRTEMDHHRLTYALGLLIGGPEGQALTQGVEQTLRRQGVHDPVAFMRPLFPELFP